MEIPEGKVPETGTWHAMVPQRMTAAAMTTSSRPMHTHRTCLSDRQVHHWGPCCPAALLSLSRPAHLVPARWVHGLFTERSQEEKLSMEQICKRRLAMLKELSALYEAQLKATLLELRLRHDTLHGGSRPAAGSVGLVVTWSVCRYGACYLHALVRLCCRGVLHAMNHCTKGPAGHACSAGQGSGETANGDVGGAQQPPDDADEGPPPAPMQVEPQEPVRSPSPHPTPRFSGEARTWAAHCGCSKLSCLCML